MDRLMPHRNLFVPLPLIVYAPKKTTLFCAKNIPIATESNKPCRIRSNLRLNGFCEGSIVIAKVYWNSNHCSREESKTKSGKIHGMPITTPTGRLRTIREALHQSK